MECLSKARGPVVGGRWQPFLGVEKCMENDRFFQKTVEVETDDDDDDYSGLNTKNKSAVYNLREIFVGVFS